jgi:hypothetical protein
VIAFFRPQKSASFVEGSMTEAEWLASSDPTAMLKVLKDRASDRQYRLFAVACARDELARAKAGQGCFNFGDELDAGHTEFFWHTDRGYEAAVLAAELMADGGPRQHFPSWFVGWAVEADAIAYAALGHDPDALVRILPEQIAATIRRYTNHPAVYLRDIFGNPFSSVSFSPDWRTDTTVGIARRMYEERDFYAMPILADALEDAGCDSEDILDHCRGANLHARGCWAVDLVLGKE